MPAGRPSRFNDQVKDKIIELAAKGYTDKQIAQVIGIHVNTLELWKKQDQDFLWSLKEAKLDADAIVEASLFNRACGYTHEEVKLFYDPKRGEVIEHKIKKHYPPDTVACIYWLKNRKPDVWRDKTEVELDQKSAFTFAYQQKDLDE